MLDVPDSYHLRRAELAALATLGHAAPAAIDYLDSENGTWRHVASALEPLWQRHAAQEVGTARDRLQLPIEHVPQLDAVNRTLADITGVQYAAVDGILPGDEFFDFLSRSMFPSTQYVRWDGAPDYTPEPDIIHEVLGHASMLADPDLAELHRLAGVAVTSLESAAEIQRLADVFWFTVEFGVVHDSDGVRAYGAGLLSSPGELAAFADDAEIRPLDIEAMCSTPYRTDVHQPVLFAADSIGHVLDVVGGWFDDLATP